MILLSWGAGPDYIPPPMLNGAQTVCGPYFPDRFESGRALSLSTPTGAYDILEVAKRLPSGARPSLLVVREDCMGRNSPRNLASLGCPAVLIVGDTQHQPGAIGRLLRYALSEPFQRIIIGNNRQHAHFFAEAGLRELYWLPALNVRALTGPTPPAPRYPMSFAGGLGERHLRRRALCLRLIAEGLPLTLARGPAAKLRKIHAESRISLNCSLNGDINMRCFEILESGSLLLTDRLSPQSGLDLMLSEGEHYVAYDGIEDCRDKARALLADEVRAAAIARAGHAHYLAALSPARMLQDFRSIVGAGRNRPVFDLAAERRVGLGAPGPLKDLLARIAIYEILQALQRRRETTRLLAMPGIDLRLVSDIADLPRFRLAVLGGESERGRAEEHVRLAGVAGQIRLEESPEAALEAGVDLILTTSGEWQAGASAALARRARIPLLLLADLHPASAMPRGPAAAGYAPVAPRSPLFVRAGAKAFDYSPPRSKG